MEKTFTCRNCGTAFAVEEGEKPRCPKCLRVHGVDGGRGEGEPSAARGRARPWMVGILVVAVGGAAGVYFALRPPRGKVGASGAGVDAAVVEALKARGIPESDVVVPVGESPALAEAGKQALAGKATPAEQAAALAAAAEGLLRASGGRPGREDLLRTQLPRTGPKAFEELQSGVPGAYAIEITSILVSMARAAGLKAEAYELRTSPRPRLRPEPFPQLSDLGVAILASDPKAKPTVLDVQLGKIVEAEGRVLSDVRLAGHLYSARAGHFYLRGEGTRANRESEWAVKLDEESPAVTATRGVVLLAFGQNDAALAALRRASEIGGGGRWDLLVCMALLRAERNEEALPLCKRAADREPGQTGPLVALAYAYLAQGEVDKAMEVVERARKIDEDDPEVHKGLAQVFVAQGNAARAHEELSKALKLDPKTRGAHLMRALLAMKDLDFDAAVSALRQEVEVDPENERIRALLATTLYRSGDREGAEKVLDEMRRRSRDAAITDRLVAQVRKEALEEDEEERADAGPSAAPDAGVAAAMEADADDDAADGGVRLELTPPGQEKRPRFFDLKP
jgi:Tfp pilus assembly protein PilF